MSNTKPVLRPFTRLRSNEVDLLVALLAATAAILAAERVAKDVNQLQRNMKPFEEKPMNFGQAIEALKQGFRVRRIGWNGKGMYLVLVQQSVSMEPGTDPVRYEPAISMYTAQGKHQIGWLASQADMLGEDWEILPEDNSRVLKAEEGV